MGKQQGLMSESKNTGCKNKKCGVSSGEIFDCLTFGSGKLSFSGYWEFPCGICARAWEKDHPGEHAWPFTDEYLAELKEKCPTLFK
jgi:hypothetical protein